MKRLGTTTGAGLVLVEMSEAELGALEKIRVAVMAVAALGQDAADALPLVEEEPEPVKEPAPAPAKAEASGTGAAPRARPTLDKKGQDKKVKLHKYEKVALVLAMQDKPTPVSELLAACEREGVTFGNKTIVGRKAAVNAQLQQCKKRGLAKLVGEGAPGKEGVWAAPAAPGKPVRGRHAPARRSGKRLNRGALLEQVKLACGMECTATEKRLLETPVDSLSVDEQLLRKEVRARMMEYLADNQK